MLASTLKLKLMGWDFPISQKELQIEKSEHPGGGKEEEHEASMTDEKEE